MVQKPTLDTPKNPVQDRNIRFSTPLTSPCELKQRLPLTEEIEENVRAHRDGIERILRREDHRLMAIVGPCSIHDPKSALEYAKKLQPLATELSDKLLILMRVYFEKPRTTIGWKGFINDPDLNRSFNIERGLAEARKLLIEINRMGIGAATEMLDPIVPQYLSELVSWTAIGARTTESQTHREMASGLSMPVGFKNNTDGSAQVAIDAMEASRHSHHFLGIDQEGRNCVLQTKGNPHGHVILRGGREGPNYDSESLLKASQAMKKARLEPALFVDCSHANSRKQFRQQELVWKNVLEQRIGGNRDIVGLMLESHINEGNQKLDGDHRHLRYGVSITDACIGWDKTDELLHYAAKILPRSEDRGV
ncbi:MAG: 3-deoxy-7-phosphoheptulonate synthase [Okeania sp. SIO1H5]|uniref:3-deoxy-7-phosphoheptulonate synthase n=1 Tax=Okeania sp. SIO1H5 TaxID=2607777 RepID=UPI0013BCF44D|nr:3-deoxy-7-phosphoheptulonate synthase [Okeania sp. SIO1H5]NET23836.1 3-deoxy-7-phosphoheptulonate synthase [Okeania sp. SIO1H5]